MPKFAANLTMLFNEHDFLDRFAAAAKAGFKAVEFLFPYAYPAAEIKSRLDANGLQLVLHNLPGGDWDAGDRGLACGVAGRRAFRSAARRPGGERERHNVHRRGGGLGCHGRGAGRNDDRQGARGGRHLPAGVL